MATTIAPHGVMMDDPASIERFRLISLRSALQLESKGIKVHRSVNARKLAKQATGLKTNDYDKLIEGVTHLIEEQTKKVVFVHEPNPDDGNIQQAEDGDTLDGGKP